MIHLKTAREESQRIGNIKMPICNSFFHPPPSALVAFSDCLGKLSSFMELYNTNTADLKSFPRVLITL